MALTEQARQHYKRILDSAKDATEREELLEGIKYNHTSGPGYLSSDKAELLSFGQQALGRYKKSTPQNLERTAGGTLKDVAVTAAKSAVGLGESVVGLANIPTAGRIGKGLESVGIDLGAAQEYLGKQYSEPQQEAFKKVKDAKGFLSTVGTAVENPSTIVHSVLESLPQMFGGMGVARGLLKTGKVASPLLAGAIGEGTLAAGSAAESIRQQTPNKTLTPGQSLMAVGSGIGTGAFGYVGGKIAQKFGFGDIDTMLAAGKLPAKSQKNVARRILEGGISEGAFEELPQSMQEQVWMNAALDRPLNEGIGEAGAMGMLAGAVMGGGANIITRNADDTKKDKFEETVANIRSYGPEKMQEIVDAIDEENAQIMDLLNNQQELQQQASLLQIDPIEFEQSLRQQIADREKLSARLRDELIPDDQRFQEGLITAPYEPVLEADLKKPAKELILGSAKTDADIRQERQELYNTLWELPTETDAAESAKVLNNVNDFIIDAAIKRQKEIDNTYLPAEAELDKINMYRLKEAMQNNEVVPVALRQSDIITKEGKPFKFAGAVQSRINAMPRPQDYEVVETSDGFIGRITDEALDPRRDQMVWEDETGKYSSEAKYWEAQRNAITQQIAEANKLDYDKPIGPIPYEQRVRMERQAKWNEKALKEVNTEPSDAQKAAGNYKKGPIKIAPFDIVIENPDGSIRSGKDDNGNEWTNKITGHYGYFSRTEGKDGDQIDVFVQPGIVNSPPIVFVIDQIDPKTKEFDEHKVIIGPRNPTDAKKLYMANYEKGWQGFGAITPMSKLSLRQWLNDNKRTKKPVKYQKPGTKIYERSRAEEHQIWVDSLIDRYDADKAKIIADSAPLKPWTGSKTDNHYIQVKRAVLSDKDVPYKALEEYASEPWAADYIYKNYPDKYKDIKGKVTVLPDESPTNDERRKSRLNVAAEIRIKYGVSLKDALELADRYPDGVLPGEYDIISGDTQTETFTDDVPSTPNDIYAGGVYVDEINPGEYAILDADGNIVQDGYSTAEAAINDMYYGKSEDIPTEESVATEQDVNSELFRSEPPAETPAEEEVQQTQRADLEAKIDAAYASGNLEAPQYMVALDLLHKRQFNGVQAILNMLKDNDANMMSKTASFKAKGRADLARLINMLGSQMYKDNLAEVTIKETVQNSFDAVKASLNTKGSKGIKEGKIDIITDDINRIIAIRDNGQGMTKEVLVDAFLTIAGSAKEDLAKGDASGGFGMAKAAFLFGNEWIEVNTVKNGRRYKFKADRKNLLHDSININVEKAPLNAHGTTLVIKVPEYVTIDGEKKYVWFPSNAGDVSFFKKPLLHNNVEINMRNTQLTNSAIKSLADDKSSAWNTKDFTPVKTGKHFDLSEYDKYTNVNFSWGSATLYIGKERTKSSFSTQHNILSAGIYQFDHTFELERWEAIPYNIILNVFPTTETDSASYPFNIRREGWKDTISKDIAALNSYVKNIALGIEAAATADQFKNIKSLPQIDIDDIGTNNVDITEFLSTPKNPKVNPDKKSDKIFTPTEVTIKDGQVTGKNASGKQATYVTDKAAEKLSESFSAEKNAPKAKDFLIDIGADDSKPIFHNNTNVDYFDLAAKNGYSAELLFAELGSVMLKVKDMITKKLSFRYRTLADKEQSFFFGISIDKKYHGVNLTIPFKSILLNPLAVTENTLPGLVYTFYDTIIHEIAHVPQRNHGEGFISEHADLMTKLAADGTDLKIRTVLGRVVKKHQKLLSLLRNEYEKSSTKNLAKSFKDSDKPDAIASQRYSNESERSTDAGTAERFKTGTTKTGQGSDSGIQSGTESNGSNLNFEVRENRVPGQGIQLADIQKMYSGQEVFQSNDGTISVRFKNGKGAIFQSIQDAGQGFIEYAIDTGQMSKNGKILGITTGNKVLLDSEFADNKTLWHENKHILDNLGMITDADNAVLNKEFNRLRKAGKLDFELSTHKDSRQAMVENRANIFAQIMTTREEYRNKPLGKFIQKIMDFFSKLFSFGQQTISGLAQEVESGSMYERAQISQPQTDAQFQVQNMTMPAQKIPESDYQDIIAQEKNLVKKLAQVGRMKLHDIKLFADKSLGSISTRLKNVNPLISSKIREMDFITSQKIVKALRTAQPLLEATKRMTKEDKIAWDWARKNADEGKVKQLAQKYNILNNVYELREILNKIRQDAIDVGYDVGFVDEYWPRVLKDQEGFLQKTQEISERPVFTEAIKAKAKSMGLSVEEFGREFPEVKAKIISDLILGRGLGIGGPGNIQSRVFDSIPKEYAEFYMNSDSALMQYIYSMTKKIEARRFFGKVPTRIAKLKRRRDAKQAKVLELENLVGLINSEGREDSNKYTDAITELIADITDINEKIETYKHQRDYTENIGTYINDLMINGHLLKKDEKMVRDILDARFHEHGTTNLVNAYKNLSYIDVMGSPISALTQIGDLAWAAYVGKVWTPKGFSNTVKNVINSVFNKSNITKEDLGIERIAQEFADFDSLSNIVSKVFKYVGLEKMDSIGKETLINNAYDNYQTLVQTKAGREQLLKELRPIFANKSNKVINDLLANEITSDVKLLVYNRLLDFQPVALSEMPEHYLHGGDWRILYMLKTYTLKQFDVYRKEVWHKIKHGDAQDRLEAMKNMLQLTAVLTLANAGADEIKDFILGKETHFEDHVIENFLTMGGANRYVRMQASREGFGSAIAQQILPPFKFINSVTKDITSDVDKGWRSLDSLPIIGKVAYWRWGRGTEFKKSIEEQDFIKEGKQFKKFKRKFEKATDKRLFINTNIDQFRQMKRHDKFKDSLSRNKAVINKLKNLEQTTNVRKRLGQLEQQRKNLIKKYFMLK